MANEKQVPVTEDPKTGKKVSRGRRLYRKKDGSYWIDNGSGFLVKMTRVQDFVDVGMEELMDQIQGNPEVDESEPALGQSAAGKAQRLTLTNFASSPEKVKEWVKKNGGIVRSFGPGWDFGVKFDTDKPWRYVDPPKTGLVEFGMDLLDLSYDLAQTVVTTKAAAVGLGGTPAGSIIAGSAAGAGMETLRQEMGQAFGIPDNRNPMQTGLAAVAGGIPTPGTAKAMSSLGGFMSEGTQELGAMLTRSERAGTLTAREVFRERIQDPIRAADRLPSLSVAARDILGRIKAWRATGADQIPQLAEADQLVKDLGQKGVTVNIRPMLNELAELTLDQGKTRGYAQSIRIGGQASNSLSGQAASTIDSIYETLGHAGATPDKVPIQIALDLRRMVDNRAKTVGALGAEKSERASAEMLEGFRGKLQDEIATIADGQMAQLGVAGPSAKPYSALMHEGKRTLDKLESFYERSGVNLRKPEDAEDKMVGFITGMYGNRKSGSMELLDWFEQHSGTKLEPVARRSVVGTKIGDEGAMGVLPRVTAMGGAPTILGQAAATLQTGLGLSPRNIVRIGQGINKMYLNTQPVRGGVVSVLQDPNLKQALAYAMQEAARKAGQ